MSNNSSYQDRLAVLEAEHKILLQEVRNNTAITQDIQQNTYEILKLFSSIKSGVKVAAYLGAALKWSVSLAAGLVAVYVAVRSYMNGQ